MITQAEISKIAYRGSISDRTIEKDYVIGWVLLGLADSHLKDLLAFKGGTALKKIYFPDYRYSEDIDFTSMGKSNVKNFVDGFKEILLNLEKGVALTFNVPEEKIEKRKDSLTFYIEFVGPLLAKLGKRNIKVDITFKEKIIFPLNERRIITVYSDSMSLKKSLKVYSLEEIVMEKLCALIGRTEPRDLYDLHFLLMINGIDFVAAKRAFSEKAESKGIDPKRLKNIFSVKESTITKMWGMRLSHQIKDLPQLNRISRETKRLLKQYKLI
ncbi:nucleotidyl transferase AbiEii/AbiGii toxin family protein [Candidatus Oleimmundimicrobium sp.]|uniref:nucleotidyl transferase AbiEii/AbiGii toxin family protein n=1 Tax=Candidatus Oleimmundimicrobium sp. TaxID=3060597 RepID=UPI00271A2A40|nr:nucleotidyl transferase AbiEii/AbiGii toxin family protein [Candidatus Oleimmundimicrobium sp.]MDO8885544.1 nucleotidyl transferase AbiEii/AbiGii toxin family protein [Candidatus Oleimmundimicrobium sp.]